MKKEYISCEVVQDLLPLYEDECCSEQSKKIVEAHLEQCEECRGKSSQYQENLPQANEAEEAEIKSIKRGIQKIKWWKNCGILSLCLAFSVVFVILPAWNYVKGSGLTYTNLKAAYIAYAFEKALVAGDYEKAYGYLDIESHYHDLLATDFEGNDEMNAKEIADGIREIEEKGFDWYNQVCKEKFMENMEILTNKNERICSYSHFYIDAQSFGWTVSFEVQTEAKTDFTLCLDISLNGIKNFHPLVAQESFDCTTGEYTSANGLEEKAFMYERLYCSPTINETVMEILYENTDYEWRKLFTY